MLPPLKRRSLIIPCANKILKGELCIPEKASALVLFAHGSGSGRLSPRNRMVADYLNRKGLATLLFDLLTPDEYLDFDNRFNIPLLTTRLQTVTQWIMQQPECNMFAIGYFGASTGAAAALIASMDIPEVKAIVSRGGRPDLALPALPHIKASTLFIVGGADTDVLKLNEKAFSHLNCEKQLDVVPGATHLFQEKGAMEQVCLLAVNWFELHLQPIKLFK